MAKKKPKKPEAKPEKAEKVMKPEEKPSGLKIVTVLSIIISLILIIEGLRGMLVMMSTPAETLYTYLSQYSLEETGMMTTEELVQMLYMTFVALIGIGIIYLVIAYFVWKKNKIAKYALTVVSLIGLLYFSIGTVISGFILYFLWVDKEMKKAFD